MGNSPELQYWLGRASYPGMTLSRMSPYVTPYVCNRRRSVPIPDVFAASPAVPALRLPPCLSQLMRLPTYDTSRPSNFFMGNSPELQLYWLGLAGGGVRNAGGWTLHTSPVLA